MLSPQVQHFAASDEQLELGTHLQQLRKKRGCCNHLFKVVEQQQEVPVTQVGGQPFHGGAGLPGPASHMRAECWAGPERGHEWEPEEQIGHHQRRPR